MYVLTYNIWNGEILVRENQVEFSDLEDAAEQYENRLRWANGLDLTTEFISITFKG